MMTAAVLAGGLGTRLRTVLSDRPKVLAPVAGRHFLAYLLDQLADAGFAEVVLCTGYLGEQVKTAFGAHWRKLHLRYSQEPQPMGTAGALRHALELLPSDDVLVLNGDSYCDVDLGSLIDFHVTHKAKATLALTEVPDASRYGAVNCDPDGAIVGFAEKGNVGPGLINAGIYVLSQRVLELIPAGFPVSLERDCFPGWIGKGLTRVSRGEAFPGHRNSRVLSGSSGLLRSSRWISPWTTATPLCAVRPRRHHQRGAELSLFSRSTGTAARNDCQV